MENKGKVGGKYLPVGTVVRLKGAEKRLMIIGFCVNTDTKENWDYSGCLYPEGLLSSDQIAVFDHSQISDVYYTGLVDEEEKEFKKNLNDYLASQEDVSTSNKEATSKENWSESNNDSSDSNK